MEKNGQDKKIVINNQEIAYKLKKSRKARRARLAVYRDISIVLTIPYNASEGFAEKILREKADWLLSKIKYFHQLGPVLLAEDNHKDYEANKKACLQFIQKKIKELNQYYGFVFNKITIKNQKTRWGSCSRAGNLNFNYKILFLSEKLADYIIVHELCHLQALNHSQKFWNLVERTIPDYRMIRRQLRKNI
jgi:predicted metal-dependent hydrolase